MALLLRIYYKGIKCIVGIVAGNVTFSGNTNHFTTPTWAYQKKELPFAPVNEDAVPFLMKGDLRDTFEALLKDTKAEQESLIKDENINGPILLLSATNDRICT